MTNAASPVSETSPATKRPTLMHRIEYYALRGVTAFIRQFSWDTACAIGEWLGELGYRPLGIRKRVVERQIAASFPELSIAQVQRMARDSYRHLGRYTIETSLLPSCTREQILELVESSEGLEHIRAAHDAGQGMILVAGHLGNWELTGAFIAAHGVTVDAIARIQANPLVDRYVNEAREAIGLHIVYDRDAVRRTPRALRAGHAMAFITDQGVLGLASTFVSFFGRPAKTPRGAAVFALKFKVPTIFVTAIRKPNGKFHFAAEPVIIEETGDRDRDVDTIVAQYTATLERWVRKAPEQYFWQHRRWRRQPPDTPDSLRDPTR